MDDAPPHDYPAAHSMDSAWFAVDTDGRVGRFNTGEDGAIPNAAAGAGGEFRARLRPPAGRGAAGAGAALPPCGAGARGAEEAPVTALERISVEPSRRCSKGCSFCASSRRWASSRRGGCAAASTCSCGARGSTKQRAAAERLRAAGVGNDRVVYLPIRGPGDDAPSDRDVASVAGGPFQSMTCLTGCGRSPRFASIAHDRTAAWCSYTQTRRAMRAPTWAALIEALSGEGGLGLKPCREGLVALRRRA